MLTLIALISKKSAQNQQKILEKKKSSLGISGNHQLIAIEVKILDKNTSENGSIQVIPEISTETSISVLQTNLGASWSVIWSILTFYRKTIL